MEDSELFKQEASDKVDMSPESRHDHHDGHFLVPSPIPTRRTRSKSASDKALGHTPQHGKITKFCREKGHGFIVPHDGSPPIFVHISDIEGDIVPKEGDEVTFRTILMPPKMEKLQAVHVHIAAMNPGVKHDHWENTTLPEDATI